MTLEDERIGWLFIQEYYTCLNKDPSALHLFYKKDSTYVHGTEGEPTDAYTGQQQISECIQACKFVDCLVLVSNLDSQPSFHGGIMIQVLGEIRNTGETKSSKFAQSFFLAKQVKGYYVLNDMFRLLKEEINSAYEPAEDIFSAVKIAKPELVAHKSPADLPLTNGIQESPNKPSPIIAVVKPKQVNGHQAKKPSGESYREKTKPASPVKPRPASPQKQPIINQSSPLVEQLKFHPVVAKTVTPPPTEAMPESQAVTPVVEEKPAAKEPKQTVEPVKKTWASMVNTNADKPTTISPLVTQQQLSTPPHQKKDTPVYKFDPSKKSDHTSEEREKYSVFIGDVPANITSTELAEAFSAFGIITCIELLGAKNIAFVEFLTIDMCRKAIGESVVVKGRRLQMEERSKRGKRSSRDGRRDDARRDDVRRDGGNERRDSVKKK